MTIETREVRRVRALFLSDVHLGMRASRVTELLDFLRWHDADVIYLVGDIVDGWRLAKGWHWPAEYHVLIEVMLRKGPYIGQAFQERANLGIRDDRKQFRVLNPRHRRSDANTMRVAP